jgi:hypothetical protein
MNINLRILIDSQMTINFHSEFLEVGIGSGIDNHHLLFKIPRDRLSEAIPARAKVLFEDAGNGQKAGIVRDIQKENSHVLLMCQFQL